MKKTPKVLDEITDVVLKYRPKPKSKAAKKRALIPKDWQQEYDLDRPLNPMYKRKLIERIAALEAENARAKERFEEFVKFICSAHCNSCKEGIPVRRNSAGYWSHREEGNYCSNHTLFCDYEKWRRQA